MRNREQYRQSGVAIIMVVVAIALMTMLGFEFSTRANLDAMSAANARDDMRAHYLARSGANLAQMMIRVQTDVVDKYRTMLGDMQVSDFAGLFMGAFGGSKDEVKDLAEALGGFQGEAVKGLGADVGTFDIAITHEDGKINMNCANGSGRSKQALQSKLDALLYQEAYNPLFEKPDSTGWQRDRQQQVSALIDYIDRDNTKYEAPGTPEEYGYQQIPDRYNAKNNYLDSVGELKLVRGVDDRMWTLFGNQFTVYGDCRINLGAVNDPRTIAAIIYLSAKNPDDPVLQDPTGMKLLALALQVTQLRALGAFFEKIDGFIEFVGNPMGALPLPPPTGAPPTGPVIQGVELDKAKLEEIAVIGARRVYRVEVTATVGRVVKRLTAIWDQGSQNQNARDPNYQKGTWVFWREE